MAPPRFVVFRQRELFTQTLTGLCRIAPRASSRARSVAT